MKVIITCLLIILNNALFGQLESPDGRYLIEYRDASQGESNVAFKNKATGKILRYESSNGYEEKRYRDVKWSPDSQYLAVTSRGTKTTIDLEVFRFGGDTVTEVRLPDYQLNIYGRHQLVGGGRCHFVKGVEWVKDGLVFCCQGSWIENYQQPGEPDQWYTFRVTLSLDNDRPSLIKMEELPYDEHWFWSEEQIKPWDKAEIERKAR